MAKRLPWITRYEDCWPVGAYAKRWLDTTRWRYKHARPLNGRAMLGRQGLVKEAINEPQARRRSLRSQSEEHHPDLQEVFTIVQCWIGIHSNDHIIRSCVPGLLVHRENLQSVTFGDCHIEEDRLMRSRQHASFTSAESASLPRSTSSEDNEVNAPVDDATALEPGVRFIRDFLQGLQPRMDNLTQKFMSAGVVDKTCLVALAGMPDWEKDQLLREDMSLKPFRMRVVRVGLAKLLEV